MIASAGGGRRYQVARLEGKVVVGLGVGADVGVVAVTIAAVTVAGGVQEHYVLGVDLGAVAPLPIVPLP